MYRKAFSLIEVLIVACIIAILVGLILPALTESRAAALDLRCKTQVRSIGQALLNYLTSHDEFFPFPDPFPEITPLTINQDVKHHLEPYLDGDDIDITRRTRPWTCPLDKDSYASAGSSYYYYAGHYRYLYEVDPPPGYQKMKIMSAYNFFPTMQIYGDSKPDHHGKINYSLIDGSIVTR